MNLFMMLKSTFKRFSFIKPSSGLSDRETFCLTTIDVFNKITGEENVYTEKDS